MAAQVSPITGIISEDTVILDFGEHEGRSIKDILELDPAFYDRLKEEKENGAFSIRRHHDKTFRLFLNPLSEMDH